MELYLRLKALASPPYSLRTAIMTGATVVVVALGSLFSAIAYKRLADVTLLSAKNWSDSVALLVSSSTTSAFVLNDIAAIESSLQQVAALPGIDRVAVFRADGRELAAAFKKDEGVHSIVAGPNRMAVALQGVQSVPGTLRENYYEAWAPIAIGKSFPGAWVQVQFSLAQRNRDLMQLWFASGIGIALLVALVLASLQLLIGRALNPIKRLSRFALDMPQHIGLQTKVSNRYIEVSQLGAALNDASRGIAQQIGRTQAIVNTATEAIIGLDNEGLVTTLNPAATSFFGRPEGTLLGNSISQCIPGLTVKALFEMFDDSASYYAGMNRILRQDFFGTREDGTLFPVEISLGQVSNIEGLRYVCIVRDVTDQRAALQFTELYERALACSHNSVFITNAELRDQPIVYVNDAFQSMLARPLHEILGKSMESLLYVNEDDPALIDLRLAIAQERNATVTLHKDLPGEGQRISELSLSPVRSDKGVLTHFVGIVLDVTARVQAEEAIAKRSAQLDAIFSLSPDGFVMFDSFDNMVFANPAFERMSGLSWPDKQTVTLSGFEDQLRGLCDETLPLPEMRGDQPDASWEARLQLVRPQTRVVQTQSRRNEAARRETIMYFRDVTHEDAVDRMKSEFLAAAAHELRTPMVSIFGFTELLIKRKYSPERQADMLETIHRQSGLLVKMINELLDLARIESRRGLDLHIDAHSLWDLVNNSVKGLMRKDTDRQVAIGDVPQATVLIDPEKMQLAMNNLLSNAFKYSPQGGTVALSAKLDQLGDTHYAVIEVRDEGLGMSPEQLTRAFERFYRADASGNIPGTGLGLSMVKEVATLHHGQIELDSVLGQGTTARLWIPLAKPFA